MEEGDFFITQENGCGGRWELTTAAALFFALQFFSSCEMPMGGACHSARIYFLRQKRNDP
jgi:hypothetical protein